MLKCFLLYLNDDTNNSDGYNIHKLISEQFPQKQDVFQITDQQFDNESRLCNKIESNFRIPNMSDRRNGSNLTRTIGLSNNYTLREEYVWCGKDKFNK